MGFDQKVKAFNYGGHMKKIFKYMDKHLGYFLILPALFFIVVFSILPIAESIKYSVFDFQLNDQQKSGLYFKEHYNVDLMTETFEYIDYYLNTEIETVEKEKTQKLLEEAKIISSESYEAIQKLLPSTGIVSLNEEEKEIIIKASDDVTEIIYNVYKEEDVFYAKEDMKMILSELETAIIKPNFIGIDNFKTAFSDKRVGFAFFITIIFTLASISLELGLGLMLALIMNRAMKGRGLVRTFSLIPWAIPTSVAALIWAYLYNGSSGIVSVLLEKVGILSNATDLLLSGKSALVAIIMADVWKTTPYMALLLLAGLQVISYSLYEASSLDGASKLQQFRHVTLPLLKPAILVALLFRTLDAFRIFDLIFVLTGGGPGGKTESISLYAYKVMFAQTRFGYGSAVVVIMAVVVAIISYLYIKFLDVQLISD